MRTLLFFSLLSILAYCQCILLIDDFESSLAWGSGMIANTTVVHSGTSSGWMHKISTTGTAAVKSDITHDWTSYNVIEFWSYSGSVTNQDVIIACTSENSSMNGWDYYSFKFNLDWTGWKRFEVYLFRMNKNRYPVGWDSIDSIGIYTAWSTNISASSVLLFDDWMLDNRLPSDSIQSTPSRFVLELSILPTKTWLSLALKNTHLASLTMLIDTMGLPNGITVTCIDTLTMASGDTSTLHLAIQAATGYSGANDFQFNLTFTSNGDIVGVVPFNVSVSGTDMLVVPLNYNWIDTVGTTSYCIPSLMPTNITSYNTIVLSMTNSVATKTFITLVLSSENGGSSGSDYYSFQINLDWIGYVEYVIGYDELAVSRSPLGLDRISRICLASSGWGATPDARTRLMVHQVILVRRFVGISPQRSLSLGLSPSSSWSFNVKLTNIATFDINDAVVIIKPDQSSTTLSWTLSTPSLSIPQGDNGNVTVTAITTANAKLGTFYGSIYLNVSGFRISNDLRVKCVVAVPKSLTHPSLIVSSTSIRTRNSSTVQWISKGFSSLRSSISSFDAIYDTVPIPARHGYWGLYYVCNDGNGLTFDMYSPWSHWCPSDRTNYTGDPYDGAWVCHALYTITSRYALVYAADGNLVAVDKAIRILMNYSQIYNALEIRDVTGSKSNSGGHLLDQTLDESSVLVRVAWAYDLAYNAMTPSQRVAIEYNLLRPMAETIRRNDAGMSNWQAWHNAAIGLAGYAIGDSEYVDFAINGPHGFKYHLQYSMNDDGLWYEGSIGYHFFTLDAYNWLMEAARAHGLDLYHTTVPCVDTNICRSKSISGMYDAPINMQYPGGSLPAINDMGPTTINGQSAHYDLAYSRAKPNPWYGYIANLNRRHDDYLVLFAGVDTIPVSSPPPLPTMYTMKNMGIDIVRSSDQYWMLKCGPHGGWHGHYDHASIVAYSNSLLLTDPGTLSYYLNIHADYYKTSHAHNTVLVAGVGQLEADGVSAGSWSGTSLGVAGTVGPDVFDLYGINRVVMLLPMSSGALVTVDSVWLYENSSYSNKLGLPHINDTNASYQYLLHTGYVLEDSLTWTTMTTAPSDEPAWTYMSDSKQTTSVNSVTKFTTSDTPLTLSDSFEDNTIRLWRNLYSVSSPVKDGTRAGKWENVVSLTSIYKTNMEHDWSNVYKVTYWMYSYVNNNQNLILLLYSENTTSVGDDYYYIKFNVTWTGWRQLNFSRSDFKLSRSPVGWHKIDKISISASGWSMTPLADTQLVLDSMILYDNNGAALWGSVLSTMDIHVHSPSPTKLYKMQAPFYPAGNKAPMLMVERHDPWFLSVMHIRNDTSSMCVLTERSNDTESLLNIYERSGASCIRGSDYYEVVMRKIDATIMARRYVNGHHDLTVLSSGSEFIPLSDNVAFIPVSVGLRISGEFGTLSSRGGNYRLDVAMSELTAIAIRVGSVNDCVKCNGGGCMLSLVAPGSSPFCNTSACAIVRMSDVNKHDVSVSISSGACPVSNDDDGDATVWVVSVIVVLGGGVGAAVMFMKNRKRQTTAVSREMSPVVNMTMESFETEYAIVFDVMIDRSSKPRVIPNRPLPMPPMKK